MGAPLGNENNPSGKNQWKKRRKVDPKYAHERMLRRTVVPDLTYGDVVTYTTVGGKEVAAEITGVRDFGDVDIVFALPEVPWALSSYAVPFGEGIGTWRHARKVVLK